jgi:hypothetical protein
MKLIDNWKQALKMFSVQAQVLAGALLVTWGSLPVALTDQIPVNYIAIPILVFGTIGRLIKQDSVDK